MPKTSVAQAGAESAAAIQGGPGGVAAGDVDFLALALAHAVKLGADATLFQAGLDSVAQVGKALLKVDAKAMEDAPLTTHWR